jgi:hypothetical protein
MARREETAQRLAEFRQQTAGRESSPAAALLEETRAARMATLAGPEMAPDIEID